MNASDRRRWILAFAISIAINEVVIGLIQQPRDEPEQRTVEPVRIVMERPRPTPRPTPVPTPKPTPPPVVHVPPHATPSPVPQVAAPKAAGPKSKHHGGAPAKAVVHHYTNFDVYRELAQRGLGRAAGVSGNGAGRGAGSGTGGGNAGTAAGNGTGGNGTGAVNANAPCGEVVFNIRGAPKNPDRNTQIESVYAEVQFPDGHTERETFPYPWIYVDPEQTDPWSSTQERLHPSDPIKAKLPPPDTDTRTYPPLIRYILDHTGPDGGTTLPDCPHAAAR